MSQLLITTYLNELAKLRKVSGTSRETVVREAFKDLLKAWARSLDLTFIPEYDFLTKAKEIRYVDGALLHTLRVPFGYWEAKDEKDDLDAEIAYKLRRGYPKSNIIFEDSTQAVLIQHGEEIMRCGVEDTPQLAKLLKLFFGYERPEIEAFRKAVEQFKSDLPAVVAAFREMIDRAYKVELGFRNAATAFLTHAQEAINPSLVDADVREMLIQHILTGEVFAAVFPGTTFHEDNSVARELHKLESTFFVGNTKHQTMKGLAPYYTAIRKAAAEIETHHEKQSFLKAIYENFYKVYNPKAADRLGVVYTPNEIVRFMVAGADWLCERHFERSLIDKDVDILDPATGTGTFICELIEHFAGQPAKLRHKYQWELHANEVAILPYYVANLNIEATYAAALGQYEEFPGLCFVDTLDNTWALRKHKGHIDDLFGSVTDDNIKRIRRQNSRRISVIIGNPPYNANQLNENENNKNREYPEIDKRIRETYIASSTAQKTKLYDMYARFFRWAADRLDANGVLALITNRSFIDSRTFDGFRAVAVKEFNEIRIVDLGGDVRANPKLSGTVHNVFGIQTGVAISFMVRRAKQKGCRIYYARRPEMESARDKLSFLANTRLSEVSAVELRPNATNLWVNVSDSDFAAPSLLPITDKNASSPSTARGLFSDMFLGVSTNRDDWLYDFDQDLLEKKVSYLLDVFNDHDVSSQEFSSKVKWSETLKRRARSGAREEFAGERVVKACYRPFCSSLLYASDLLVDRPGLGWKVFNGNSGNIALVYTQPGSQKPFMACAVSSPPDLHFVGAAAGTEYIPRYRVNGDQHVDNVTDWALATFRRHYKADRAKTTREISKDAIFQYVYAVLHDPVYRQKYELDLKRAFPRIPLYSDFWKWADWGKTLINVHIEYEVVTPFPLKRMESRDDAARQAGQSPRVILKADKAAGRIIVDSETILSGFPEETWNYILGNRCALEWVLDQYKEKAPKDLTVRKRFNTYRFSQYKERAIDLLARVTTISVQTVKITKEMNEATR